MAQHYKNHRRLVPMLHFFLLALILVTTVGAVNNLFRSFGNSDRLYSAALLVAVSVILIFMFFFMRIFALKAQDRAIQADERLRHFVLTGKLPDSRLTIRQLIALRFASDEELPELAQRAAEQHLSPNMIKQEIKYWKGDYHRV